VYSTIYEETYSIGLESTRSAVDYVLSYYVKGNIMTKYHENEVNDYSDLDESK
jgi:hypothetical protein